VSPGFVCGNQIHLKRQNFKSPLKIKAVLGNSTAFVAAVPHPMAVTTTTWQLQPGLKPRKNWKSGIWSLELITKRQPTKPALFVEQVTKDFSLKKKKKGSGQAEHMAVMRCTLAYFGSYLKFIAYITIKERAYLIGHLFLTLKK
jgi:hypothetical protein